MKITDFEPAAPATRIGSSTDSTALAGVTILGGSPYAGQVLIATGSNSASWQSSASNSVSFGSNATDVSSYSTGGTIASNSRADHIHRGVHSISHASNTFYGDVVLTTEGDLGITSPASGTFAFKAVSGGGGGGGGASISACMAQRTTSLATTTNPTALAYNAADLYDPDGWHDPSSNAHRFTCPAGKGGKVFVMSWSVEHNSNTGATAYITVKKNAGGAVVAQSPIFPYFTYVGSAPVYLDDGDYVEVFVTNRTSGSIIQTDAPTTFAIMG